MTISTSRHFPFGFPMLMFTFSCLLLSFCLAENLQFSFSSFSTNNNQMLKFSSNSNVDHQALQVTRNSGSSTDFYNSSGQITYALPLQLWHESYDYLASFNTSFLLNSGPIMEGNKSNATGGGMTFILSSRPAVSNLPNSYGEWLGLFDGNATKQDGQIVAIEFDTFKDSFDADGNHVGIDVDGSVKSVRVEPLSPHNVTLTLTDPALRAGINTSVWIDYDGHLNTLDVYLVNQGPDLWTKPADPIISRYTINLRKHGLPQDVYVGFSASLGTILESHCVLQWNFSSSDFPSSSQIGIIIGSVIGSVLAVVLLAALAVGLLVRSRRRKKALFVMQDLTSRHYGPRKFPYRELKKATMGFSEENSLGKGGFGAVYKGVLRSGANGTTEVAVKCLSKESTQGEKEFKAEVMSMGGMRHKNLVQLLGWSYEHSSLMLVYEYLPNGSLDQWIGQGQEEREKVMGWERRFHVMKGLAAGLLYLHEEWEMVVIHRDLKPSNVMLDAEFNARIGDFGLAKLINLKQESAQTATIAGTFGYMAPESLEQGIISKETDIYSLGAIAIELAIGRRISINFLHSLAHLLDQESSPSLQEVADPRLSSFDPTQLELLLRLGLACCHPDPPARPSIREVVHALETSGASAMTASPSLSSFSASSYASIPRVQISEPSTLVAMEITAGR